MSSTTSFPATFRPPNRPGHFLLGVWPEYRRDPLGIFVKAAREQGDIVQLRFGPYINYLISHPDYIQQVLQTNNRHYRHDPFSTDLLKLVSGLNLVTSDGDYWLRQRRLMQPAFHRQRIAGFGQIMTDTTLKMLKRWEVTAARGQFLNMCEAMMATPR
jgi:cytochrome P450